MFARLTTLIAFFWLGACSVNGLLTEFMVEEDRATVNRLLADEDAYRAFLSDTTVKSWDDRHGTQIEYHGADGRTWLVYPGNLRSVQGRWEVRMTNDTARLCYLYGTDTFNPVTRRRGGTWECQPGILRLLDDIMVDGDVLELRTRGAFPQALPPRVNISLNTVKETVGLGPLTQPDKIAWSYTR